MNRHKIAFLAAIAFSAGAAAQNFNINGEVIPAKNVSEITFENGKMIFWIEGQPHQYDVNERMRVQCQPLMLSDLSAQNPDLSVAFGRVARMANLSDRYARYAMALPDNDAMEKVMAPWRKYFVYAPQYADNATRNEAYSAKDAAAKAVVSVPDYETMPRTVLADQTQPVVMNLNHQLHLFGEALTLENFSDNVSKWPLLFTTDGEILGNAADIFSDPAPTMVHNGALFRSNKFSTRFDESIPIEMRIEAEDDVVYQAAFDDGFNSYVCPKPDSEQEEKYGNVSGGYRCMYKRSTSRNEFSFKLPKVSAALYDVYVVTVPYAMHSGDAQDELCYEFYTEMNYISTDGVEQKAKSETFTTNPLSCDTVKVFEDFQFPVSYIGINGAYPTLYFRSSAKSTSKKNHNNLCIDYILLRRKS